MNQIQDTRLSGKMDGGEWWQRVESAEAMVPSERRLSVSRAPIDHPLNVDRRTHQGKDVRRIDRAERQLDSN